MRKSFLLFSLVLGLLTASVQSCQKTDTRLPSQDAANPAKTAVNLGNDLGADDRECESCRGTLEINPEDEGGYLVKLESQRCPNNPFVDPISFLANAIVNRSVPIGHGRVYKLTIQSLVKVENKRIFYATLHMPPYPSLQLPGGVLEVPKSGIASALFLGRSNCGCGWAYDCTFE